MQIETATHESLKIEIEIHHYDLSVWRELKAIAPKNRILFVKLFRMMYKTSLRDALKIYDMI